MIHIELDNIETDKKFGARLPKCKFCKIQFAKFCDLEWHLKAKHEECTQFECDKCKKTFVTEWRMKKHPLKQKYKTVLFLHKQCKVSI